jgi:hypothetical protein
MTLPTNPSPNGTPHDFNASLDLSHAAADLPCWEQVYRAMWANFQAMVDHRKPGTHQRDGIDRSIILDNAQQYFVDEKVRGRNKKTGKVYEDVLLERWSVFERKEPGWVCRPLRAHFIAYAIAPLGLCHLLDVPLLQRAWSHYQEEWTRAYGTRSCQSCRSPNGRRWTTISVPVPADKLRRAMGRASILRFNPFAWDDEATFLPPPPPVPPTPVQLPPALAPVKRPSMQQGLLPFA